MTELTRRTVLIAGAVGPLAACGTSTDKVKPASMPVSGQALAGTADIPVGSGKVVGDTVVTQPAAGKFEAFIARCTHAGCVLPGVEGDSINCPCHGSRFGLDGAVLRGPAMQPLTPVKVTVKGGLVVAD
ncbi:ubiquinol-cytochrome c reductase iron-sulfur subunit [Mycobacterium sp. DL592]|uniref:QcrA and Rieske domain-containing protein n=1 Tax=Mycobacterium sp. DL592 TaxID=2675524 RepID=UPI00141EB007|nr:Rieske (2Fe-2S) protein [Mycobacterium sp. DL592]